MVFDLLSDPLISVEEKAGGRRRVSLPALLALLAQDRVLDYPAQRSHQRHAWHALTVQLAALALQRAGGGGLPVEAADWTRLLGGLAGEASATAWSLAAASERPAFLQAPGGSTETWGRVETPDALDMLVTSKNHDVKRARMAGAEPEDWLFALVTLQTMEGFMGAGNYGIARMNGGYGSRACVALDHGLGPGWRFAREVRLLLANRDVWQQFAPFRRTGGIALVHLLPWDGRTSLSPQDLDPWFVEICRRVRLEAEGGRLVARTAGSKAARIAAQASKGSLGDPWVPVEKRKEGAAALSLSAEGFGYRRMQELLFDRGKWEPAAFQLPVESDPDDGLAVYACALARGQGKTEGFHERRVPLSRKVQRMLTRRATDPIAAAAAERVEAVGRLSGKVLRPALFCLHQGGPPGEALKYDDHSSAALARTVLKRFDAWVDEGFFPALWRELEPEAAAERRTERAAWLQGCAERALALLREAAARQPLPGIRRYRAQVRAESLFHGALHRHLPELRQPREVTRDERAEPVAAA